MVQNKIELFVKINIFVAPDNLIIKRIAVRGGLFVYLRVSLLPKYTLSSSSQKWDFVWSTHS